MTVNVLVLEEDTVLAAITMRVLARAGYAALHTQEPQRVQSLLGQRPFDLLIYSLSLPNPEGLENIRAARHHIDQLAIVVLNGGRQLRSFTPSVVRMFESIGADEVLKKPFAAHDLIAAVSFAISHRNPQLLSTAR